MDERWEEWASDAAVRATRREILDDRFAGWLAALADAPIVMQGRNEHNRRVARQTTVQLRSGLLWVAQYWADNADDEVHLRISGSSRDVPDWPHDCGRDRPVPDPTNIEVCYHCTAIGVPSTHDWGYGALVPAFEAFCQEGSNQEQPTSTATDRSRSHAGPARTSTSRSSGR